MKKNFLQDVIPANQKRSIRDIPLPNHKERKPKKEAQLKTKQEVYKQEEVFESILQEEEVEQKFHTPTYQEEEEESVQPPKPRAKKRKSSFMKKVATYFVLGIIIFVVFMVSRTNATIVIHPKKVSQEINTVIPLDTTNQLATKTQVSKTISKTLPATSEKQVEKQASGKIKIINKHKETPQELVKNTRFQTPNGLIYRIRDSITVPGYTMSGSTIVPGTLEVDVFADSAGEEYNTSNAKFTIPGFSGKEQFDKITAESVGNIAGGYIGIQKVVSDEAKEQAQKDLEIELKTQIEQIQDQSTEYVLVPDLSTLSYGEIQDKAEGDSVILTLSANVQAYSFVKKDLFNFVGQNTVTGAVATDSFDLESKKLTYVVDQKTVKITGLTEITWLTDIEKLKKDFSGKKRSEIGAIIDSYHSFAKADAKLKPFWKSRFPSDPSKIEVTLTE